VFHRQDWKSGAVAIAMSGEYKDNEDMGETFVYTGAGGQEKDKTKQVSCSFASFCPDHYVVHIFVCGD
jgi:hypothetical protein